MNAKVVMFVLLLVAILPAATLAADAVITNTVSNPSAQDLFPTQNTGDSRALAAQVTQEIRKSNDEIISKVNANNDDNFRAFDARLLAAITDIKTKVALGAIGAALIVNALAAFLVMRTMKNYSYEKYQEKMNTEYQKKVELMGKQLEEKDHTIAGLQQMAAPAQYPQVPTNTIGMEFGQAAANEMSQMNAWQAQPAYHGSWAAPIPVTPEYSRVPTGYQYTERPIDNPMDSPQWNPQQNNQPR